MKAILAVPAFRARASLGTARRSAVRLVLLPLLACAAGACSFEGYVPTMKPPKLAQSELEIADLQLGQTLQNSLDCTEDRCRARHRMVVPQPGRLVVSVAGPTGDEKGEGPRLARVVLEGSLQQILGMEYAGKLSPLVLEGEVESGVYFVLVQGMAGAFDYEVTARFTPSGEAPVAVAAAEEPLSKGWTPPPPTSGGTKYPPRSGAKPGDLRDGADFAYDPRRDLRTLQRYEFAQDSASMLKGEPGVSVGNPFVEKQVQREIRYYLADSAIYQSDVREADFLISVQVGSRSTTWYSINGTLYDRPYDSYFDSWRSVGLYVQAHSYRDGMLVIDFIDPKTGELIWHGWTVEPISPSAKDDSIIKQAVTNVLSQF